MCLLPDERGSLLTALCAMMGVLLHIHFVFRVDIIVCNLISA
jgi:hypothetical protein